MNDLRRLVDEFSKNWGRKYLVTSPNGEDATPSTSQVHQLDPLSNRGNDVELMKVFPIKPKDDPRLVQIWFEHILPALPKILSPSLGGTYAVSLVRRGLRGIGAKPCIQIESPRIPNPRIKQTIKDSLNDIYTDNNHRWVSVRFLKGSVKKLNGEKDEDHDDVEESAESQRYRFNLVRPYSKLRLSASLGLKCSKRVVATLGGFVDIGGEKYMLTSEHFVTHSQEPANIDVDDTELETITSPSRYDLNWMENNLKQTKRDLDYEINLRIRKIYGDQEIPVDDLSRQVLTSELHGRVEQVKSLLEQVKKPANEYAIGTVFMMSTEPRKAAVPRSVADVARLKNKKLEAMYHMDWSLCKLDTDKAQALENRHKYRSCQEATEDDYIEETDAANQPGDICHETCDVASGVAVYYVGQGSKHRTGIVNIPSLISRDSSTTLDWGILSSDDQEIPYEHVAGDSGAWVIRQNGNKVMGQVHSYSSGQVLFTPIDIIFADIAKECGVDAHLPSPPSGSRQLVSADSARPLCATPPTPPMRSLKFLRPSPVASDDPPKISSTGEMTSPARASQPAINLLSHSKINAGSCQNTASNLIIDHPSFVPSLTNSPRSSVTISESPGTPPPLDLEALPHTQSEDRQMEECTFSPHLSQDDKVRSPASEISIPSVSKGSHRLQVQKSIDPSRPKTRLRFRFQFSVRAPTWPMTRRGDFGKLQKPSAKTIQLVLFQARSLPMPASSLVDKTSQISRRIGTLDPLR